LQEGISSTAWVVGDQHAEREELHRQWKKSQRLTAEAERLKLDLEIDPTMVSVADESTLQKLDAAGALAESAVGLLESTAKDVEDAVQPQALHSPATALIMKAIEQEIGELQMDAMQSRADIEQQLAPGTLQPPTPTQPLAIAPTSPQRSEIRALPPVPPLAIKKQPMSKVPKIPLHKLPQARPTSGPSSSRPNSSRMLDSGRSTARSRAGALSARSHTALENVEANHAAALVRMMQKGASIRKKSSRSSATRDAVLKARHMSLSSDLKRLHIRDPEKMKVVESFMKIEHLHQVREGGIGGDLRPKCAVIGFLLEKNATLNVLFDTAEVCQQWIEGAEFLMSHKKNLCALGDLVENADNGI